MEKYKLNSICSTDSVTTQILCPLEKAWRIDISLCLFVSIFSILNVNSNKFKKQNKDVGRLESLDQGKLPLEPV